MDKLAEIEKQKENLLKEMDIVADKFIKLSKELRKLRKKEKELKDGK